MEQIHPFEKAGLGKAPFRVVGLSENRGPIVYEHDGITCTVGAPGQPMGVCDYCYTGIAEQYEIKSADGRRFIVGCECVKKTEDDGLISEVKREHRKAEHRKADVRIMSALALWDRQDMRDLLYSRPNPNGKGSIGNYIDWCFIFAGRAGKIKVAKIVEAAARELEATHGTDK